MCSLWPCGIFNPQPPKPLRKSYSMKPTITNVHKGLQSVYEDPDALQVNTEPGWQHWFLLVKWWKYSTLWQPAVTDGNQTEVVVRPVPRPRTKLMSKPELLIPRTNDADAVDADHSSSSEVRWPVATHSPASHGLCHMMFLSLSCCQYSHVYEYIALDFERLRPVRPPPKPPVSRPGVSDQPTAGLGRSDPSTSLISEEVFVLYWLFHTFSSDCWLYVCRVTHLLMCDNRQKLAASIWFLPALKFLKIK